MSEEQASKYAIHSGAVPSQVRGVERIVGIRDRERFVVAGGLRGDCRHDTRERALMQARRGTRRILMYYGKWYSEILSERPPQQSLLI
ncbi:hypothetical protein K469DRAFT_276911 [Zopfia rhizophila CBS 207.26]|uniref:Uncharacterized protein n=1 Tax=Zopfia rhizophila CBS 207.26 TaxID=1314779 RepID=A0A6A6DSK5_9PEZI|nr:hypothetical protein K469DRAFT_276911 [Zopfia rhizophila CBS 207.26]